jgi:hypothetical protein
MHSLRLGQVASARSGDKGNHANVAVIAYTEAGFAYLQRELTAERVAAYFAGLGHTGVVRYELPNVDALNFVLENALAGGASTSPRIDTQGKLLGTAILELELPCPADVSALVNPAASSVPAP